ncbi:MAG: hypothetical protein GC168_14665 [Candidatus Hydrogenedens sp.]|nr:hypothetical protein [Candidatus Hydrogenedens sp.]
MGGTFQRVQFTPELLPAEILGRFGPSIWRK